MQDKWSKIQTENHTYKHKKNLINQYQVFNFIKKENFIYLLLLLLQQLPQ